MANERMTDEQLAERFGRRESGQPLFEPGEFGYHRPKDHTAGDICWSEFKNHIWCYVCEMDYHYAQDCYVIRPSWMSAESWERHIDTLPDKPQIRAGTCPGTW